MSNIRLWVNRIVCGLIFGFFAWLCEQLNIRPAACFTIAVFVFFLIVFIFEIIKRLYKEED